MTDLETAVELAAAAVDALLAGIESAAAVAASVGDGAAAAEDSIVGLPHWTCWHNAVAEPVGTVAADGIVGVEVVGPWLASADAWLLPQLLSVAVGAFACSVAVAANPLLAAW